MAFIANILSALRRRRESRQFWAQFNSLLDPKVAQTLITNPAALVSGPRVYELTVAFTDLAGFCNVLPETSPQSLAESMARVQDLVDEVAVRHHGFVEASLGCAAKAAFGRPESPPDHAERAVAAVLDIRRELQRDNPEGFPVRAGVATGEVAVGNFGLRHRYVYGTQGYAVYLAQRLEGANRLFGTTVLISARTAELVAGRYLLRPVGRLKLPDLPTPATAYEPMAPLEDATDAERRAAEGTRDLVEHFIAGRFEECLQAVDRLEWLDGNDKLLGLYRSLAGRYLHEPPGEEFDGRIKVGG